MIGIILAEIYISAKVLAYQIDKRSLIYEHNSEKNKKLYRN